MEGKPVQAILVAHTIRVVFETAPLDSALTADCRSQAISLKTPAARKMSVITIYRQLWSHNLDLG